MQTIHKYPLQSVGDARIQTHKGAQIISAQAQRGLPCIWALVDTDQPKVNRIIQVHITGGDFCQITVGVPIGTVLLEAGNFVIHVFDGGEE